MEIIISDPKIADKYWGGKAILNHAAHDGPAAARHANVRLLKESPDDALDVLDGAPVEELTLAGEDIIVDAAVEYLDGQSG